MIHSLSGGVIRGEKFCDFAKVKLLEGENAGKEFWYISENTYQENDVVLVPFSNMEVKGKIVRIDKNVSSFSAPIPTKNAKKIIKKI